VNFWVNLRLIFDSFDISSDDVEENEEGNNEKGE
jgi:hypothetical protein